MAKRIILLSDGTGNSASKVWRTNVWRVFESLDLSSSDQVAFYDDGVGTSSFKPLAIIGGAFGYGLKRNVLDLYKFVCRNYRTAAEYEQEYGKTAPQGTKFENDEIYGFGFSRGAFTIRVVVGLIADQGLVTYSTESELEDKARAAYRAYRAKHFHSIFRFEDLFRAIRSVFVPSSHNELERPVQKIRFLGLWDTVAAYGLPVDEWTRGISKWIWPLELPGRKLVSKVDRACHAVCLDDERTTFQPVLWNEEYQADPKTPRWPIESQKISQVWFAGVHSNVGGGYPDDSLAHVPLIWMMNEAEKTGLRFKKPPNTDFDAVKLAASYADKDGRLYDSRSGLGGYYRYGPRKVHDLCHMRLSRSAEDKVEIQLPKIHESVFGRVGVGAHLYAPIGLPPEYAVVTTAGEVVRRPWLGETDAQRDARCAAQDRVWNVVWRRRAVYFLTVFASLHLVLYPLYRITFPTQELQTPLRLVSDTVRLAGAFLPSGASRWIDAYARDPGWFLISAVFVALLVGNGANLGSIINDRMRRIWNGETMLGGAVAGRRSRSFLWKLLLALLGYVAVYPIFVWYGPSWLTLPDTAHMLFLKYTAQPVRALAILFLLVAFLPEAFIYWLRELRAYKWTLNKLKMVVAPLVFALLTAWYVSAFASHFLFDVRDSLGSFCADAENAVTPPFCMNQNLAQCDSSKAELSPPPALTCTPSCKPYTVDLDFSTSASLLDKKKLCYPAGVTLEGGRSYLVTVERLNNGQWEFWNEKSHTYGLAVAELPRWKRVVMALLYPLRRSIDRPWGSVITRFGPTGNEENFMDPDKVPNPPENLGEEMKPKKDGQLFFYLNEPVVGFWGVESFFRNLLGVKAVARVTIKQTK